MSGATYDGIGVGQAQKTRVCTRCLTAAQGHMHRALPHALCQCQVPKTPCHVLIHFDASGCFVELRTAVLDPCHRASQMRLFGLACLITAHKPLPVPLEHVAAQLGFEEEDEATTFAEQSGAVVDHAARQLDTKLSRVVGNG